MIESPVAFALFAAVALAFSDLAIRPGARHTTAFTGSLVLASVHFILFAPLALWRFPHMDIWNPGFWWYVASGAMDPGLGPLCYFIGVSRVGIARGSSIIATYPLFSTAGAVLLVGEHPNPWVWTGTVAIVVGVASLASERRTQTVDRSGFVFLLLAALFLGLAHPFRKIGLNYIPSAVVGLAIAPAGCFATLFLIAPLLQADARLNLNRKGVGYYSLHAAGNGLALFLILTALRLGEVSVVIPLTRTFPLIVIFLAWLFLRQKEPITVRLLFGAILIVLGAAVITGLGT